jgi:F420-non-reducing hydrogenase small subunit
VSVLDVHEKLFDIIDAADLVFWPIALDIKYKDVESMPDDHIDVTLFNGAIRNSENEQIAELLRQKSRILVAYGSCAYLGGIPGLANLYSRKEILDRVYHDNITTQNEDHTEPVIQYDVPEGKLELPEFYDIVKTLDQVVDVDYYLPGCPPQSERLLEVFTAIVSGAELPPPGSVIGAYEKTMCDDCERKKSDNKHIKRFYRPFEIEDDGETCFLEQGVLCMGPATRGGCGSRCIKGMAPCRGCYGPSAESPDPGAKMMSSIATMIDTNDPAMIDDIIDQLQDPAGSFYRFSMPGATINKKIQVPELT